MKRLIIYPILFIVTLAIASKGFDFSQNNLLVPFVVVLSYFTIFFIIATIIKDNSIVDMGWGLGFVVGAITTLLTSPNPTILSYLIVGIISVWGLRLSIRLISRNFGKPEDFRYAQWRKEWGSKVVLIAFFRVFMIQGIINFIVGSAAYVVIQSNQMDDFVVNDYRWWIVIFGLILTLMGLFYEVVGDEQLKRHIKKKTRTLLQTGLWSQTRHPNYFGEILIWTGLYISGLPILLIKDYTLYYSLLVISPLLMAVVLLKISTPLLEKHMKKYDGWDSYTKQVPMIFPWSKKK